MNLTPENSIHLCMSIVLLVVLKSDAVSAPKLRGQDLHLCGHTCKHQQKYNACKHYA